jgi:HEAT repeat protein
VSVRQRRLVRGLSSSKDARRWSAASELARAGDERALRRVARTLEGRGSEQGRAAAAYVLGFSGESGFADVLARRLADRDESPVVRAHAAEALGHLLQHQPVLAEIRQPIVASLDDPEPEVRFWCVFAAAALELQESRGRLQRLRSDDAFVEGWWTVGQEAEWALRCLDGEEHPPLPDRV